MHSEGLPRTPASCAVGLRLVTQILLVLKARARAKCDFFSKSMHVDCGFSYLAEFETLCSVTMVNYISEA